MDDGIHEQMSGRDGPKAGRQLLTLNGSTQNRQEFRPQENRRQW